MLSDNFKEVLDILAKDENLQVQYLKALNVSPLADELALRFEDIYIPFKANIESEGVYNGFIPTLFEMKKLEEINDLFDSMSDNAEIWNVNALHNQEWQTIRKLANELLIDKVNRP